jgi:hypothetical protein
MRGYAVELPFRPFDEQRHIVLGHRSSNFSVHRVAAATVQNADKVVVTSHTGAGMKYRCAGVRGGGGALLEKPCIYEHSIGGSRRHSNQSLIEHHVCYPSIALG